MERIAWKKEYEIGIAKIDNQHRKLIELAVLFQQALDLGKDEAVAEETLDALVAYTQTHFESEVQILLANGGEDWLGLRKEHQELTDELEAIRHRYREFPSEQIVRELEEWIAEKIIPHFLESDRKAFSAVGSP